MGNFESLIMEPLDERKWVSASMHKKVDKKDNLFDLFDMSCRPNKTMLNHAGNLENT